MRKFYRSDLHLLHQLSGAYRDRRSSASTPSRWRSLIHWADIVDGALYESPEAAVEMAAPAMKLTLIIESTQDLEFIPRADSAADRDVAGRGAGAAVRRRPAAAAARAAREGIELIRDRSEERDGTIYFDITDQPVEGYNKFIPYYLHPKPRTRSACRSRASAQRWRWDRIRGPRPIQRRW